MRGGGGEGPHALWGRVTTLCSRYRGLPQPEADKGGGNPNQHFSQGMRAYQMWDEARKFFAAGKKRHSEVAEVAEDFGLADVSLVTSKYCLWLDIRTSDDAGPHGNGRRIDQEMTIAVQKEAEATDRLNVYLFVIMDGEIDMEDGRFVQAAY